MKKFLLVLFAAVLTLSAVAATNHSRANMRVDYSFKSIYISSDSLHFKRPETFMLQVAPDESRFFCIRTEFYDSLAASPGGKELIDKMTMDALENSGGIQRNAAGEITGITVHQDVFDNVPRRGESTNVYKYPEKMSMTVYDCLPGPEKDYLTYEVGMNDLEWEPGDSTRLILGYECQNAHTLYHGRRWTAWYAPDIAVSEGPWQFYGLPGLILRAESDGGEYVYEATSVSGCDEQIKDLPGNPDVEKTTRKEFLKEKLNRAQYPSKAYGIVAKKTTVYRDFPETDYK